MAAKSEKTTAAGTRSAAKKTTTTRRTTASKGKTSPEITDEMIAERAYELHLAEPWASEVDNWLRAETELRAN
jgi:hypothetical protein